MLESLLLGTLGSVVASIIFLSALYSLRPRIAFSPFIADQSNNGSTMFAFKIINKSKWSLVRLEFQLTLITPRSVHGGIILSNDLIPLTKNEFFEIGAFRKEDREAHYAMRLGTPENLHTMCKSDGQFLYLTVSAQHSLSGFQKVFVKHYHLKSDIKKGHHEFGLGLDVK